MPFLPPGDCEITIELAGFAAAERSERVPIGETTSLDVTLNISTDGAMSFESRTW